jgi:NAD(P)-dependent dehydrogenase (short-subunit alcohol dehydrogenase family)
MADSEVEGAVVTGAAGELGAAVARNLAADGIRVYATDLTDAAGGDGIVPLRLDVTDRDAVFALARRAAGESALRTWVNAAGIFLPVAVGVAEEDDWHRIIAVNLTGTYHGCAAALEVMAGAGGRIVNVGSISGQFGGASVHPAYGASKAGVHNLTKSYAQAGIRHGVFCNAVAPGPIEGRMISKFGEDALDHLRRRHPLGRIGAMDEVVHAIRYLADPRAGYTNGAILQVNGGQLMTG